MFRFIPIRAFGYHSIIRIRDIDAVLNNYLILKQKADVTGSTCAVVLKGNVHGLGVSDVAPVLYKSGARLFFIEDLSEGIELREILPQRDAKIYVMAGLLKNDEKFMHEHSLIPCLNSLDQIKNWNAFCEGREKNSAVIHLDAHMNRIGLLDNEVKQLSEHYFELTSNIKVDFYMSHLFDIKSSDSRNSHMQLNVLKGYLTKLPPNKVSFSCTDGMILLKSDEFNLDIVRPGIGLVGGGPNVNSPISKDAKHTMEIYTKISQIKTVPKGAKIGYGGKYEAKRDMKIALAHIGYKDGYLSSLSETDQNPKGAFMFIDKYKLPVIGRISLGVTTLDVTDVPNEILEKFGYVEVIGPNVDIKYLADIIGCYEILMSLGRPNNKINDFTLSEYSNKFNQ